ncbi:MAG: helix-turn-helix domain-containing protein [Deltaproteobacteria bacterium]|nr:helix-turn-helix domain-containing protein [Deltaproteobacteria bacterium]
MTESKNFYRPSTVSLPGETLVDVLAKRGMSQAELAQRMGRPKKTINEIVKGKTVITPDTALELERVLSEPTASFWLSREQQYRESLARQDEERRLTEYDVEITKWHLPLNDMVRRNWLPSMSTRAERAREVLSFFGMATPENWKALYIDHQAMWRRTPSVSEKHGKIAAWLRRGEAQAQKVTTAPYDRDGFIAVLKEIRDRLLTKKKLADILPEIERLCAAVGVVVIMVEEFAGAGIKAAARWLSQDKALIQISYLWDRLDIFWFNFFHEAAHVLLHGKREVFIEDDDHAPDVAVEEAEADRFASDTLIEPKALRTFLQRTVIDTPDVIRFARLVGVDPCIVVGRLRREKVVSPAFGNELMVKLGKNAKG